MEALGEDVFRAAGAFFTSSGFGGLMAVVAAVIAARAVSERLEGDRAIAEKRHDHERAMAAIADSRQRWWEVLFWVDEDAARFDDDPFLDCLAALADEAETHPQIEALNAVLSRRYPGE